jgi:hypothetical protein
MKATVYYGSGDVRVETVVLQKSLEDKRSFRSELAYAATPKIWHTNSA